MTLRVGILDSTFRGFDPSITHNQNPPSEMLYVDVGLSPGPVLDSCDVLVVTASSARLAPMHPRRVLWLAENREYEPHPPRHVLSEYDLILSNDMALVEQWPGKAKWLTLVGTWIAAQAEVPRKTRPLSMLASSKVATTGHRYRYDVGAMLREGDYDCDFYGRLFGYQVDDKATALVTYEFSIVIEPAHYASLMTEKLFDCFAARTVPIYWGDTSMLSYLGFDPIGVLAFDDLSDLATILEERPRYEHFANAVEHNYNRIWQTPSTEHLLIPILRDYFHL